MLSGKYEQIPPKENFSEQKLKIKEFQQPKLIEKCYFLLKLLCFISIGALLIVVYQEKNEINNNFKQIQKLNRKISYLQTKRVDALAKRVQKLSKSAYLNQELLNIQKNSTQSGKSRLRQNETIRIIDMLKKDHEGRSIQQVLYDEDTQQKRQKFMQERKEFLSDKTQFESLSLIQHNILLTEEDARLKQEAELKEYERLNYKYHLNKVSYELPICAILTGYNNNADFRIELNLNSIFSQNYSNFFVALVNDASDDGSDEVYRKYFAFHNLSSDKFVYIENKVRKTALENIYDLIINHCSEDSIVFNIDADDELIGTNVFKVFNAEYQRTKGGVLYSSMYKYQQGIAVQPRKKSEYTQEQKRNNKYREVRKRFAHLKTFRAEIFHQIKKQDLLDVDEEFYKITYDQVIFFPLLEMSCQRVHFVQGFHYLYKIGSGLNDYEVNEKEQLRVAEVVQHKNKYDCLSQFDAKMRIKQSQQITKKKI